MNMKRLFHFISLVLLAGFIMTLGACESDPCSFNIDKHEILTGIDIPKSNNGACLPQTDMGFKLSVWELDTLALASGTYENLDGYIDHFSFEKLKGEINQEKIALVPDVFQASLLGKDLYYREGERNGKKWIMIINRVTGVLFGEIITLNPEKEE